MRRERACHAPLRHAFLGPRASPAGVKSTTWHGALCRSGGGPSTATLQQVSSTSRPDSGQRRHRRQALPCCSQVAVRPRGPAAETNTWTRLGRGVGAPLRRVPQQRTRAPLFSSSAAPRASTGQAARCDAAQIIDGRATVASRCAAHRAIRPSTGAAARSHATGSAGYSRGWKGGTRVRESGSERRESGREKRWWWSRGKLARA
jgi:hypothetical protein